MLSADLLQHGRHVLTVCNACRYCEGYCPVFLAVERRRSFRVGDLTYLANLCHDCGECLSACQYAPPHEFGINVPRTLAEIRVNAYAHYCWPRFLAGMLEHQRLLVTLALAVGFVAALIVAKSAFAPGPLFRPYPDGDFYQVVPHDVMVALFGSVAMFVLAALITGCVRCWRDLSLEKRVRPLFGSMRDPFLTGLRDALTLRHLQSGGDTDCIQAEDARSPWRRRFHHLTFYGFALCFASTSVAALYHSAFGWRAPHAYTSLPVVLGTIGGLGLVIGPIGLLALRRTRDSARDAGPAGLESSFAVLLLLTSATGLLLLVWREGPAMALLLIVHLGLVLALLLTLPYGKFVHGTYRTIALMKFAAEHGRGHRGV